MKRSIEDVFMDFLKLGDYNSGDDPFSFSEFDRLLSKNQDFPKIVLLRRYQEGLEFRFLHDGSSILIPKDLIVFVENFSSYSGSELRHREVESDLGRFLVVLSNIIESSKTSSPNDSLLANLVELLEIGTSSLREKIKKVRKGDEVFIPHISYLTRNKFFEI